MKANVLNMEGEIIEQIELPDVFSEKIRQDIIQKIYEISKKKKPYAPYWLAGLRHSARGKIRHARRKYKTAYGYGISRVPRKVMTRRGLRFYWVAAGIPSARGGRRAHPPKIEAMLKKLKATKKERKAAIRSAIAATASPEIVKKKYNVEIKLPLVVEGITEAKTKELRKKLKTILKEAYDIAIPKKRIRAGKGKARKKYRKSKGLLIVIGKDEKMKSKFFETCKAKDLNVSILAPGGKAGRICIYTKKAIQELKELK